MRPIEPALLDWALPLQDQPAIGSAEPSDLPSMRSAGRELPTGEDGWRALLAQVYEHRLEVFLLANLRRFARTDEVRGPLLEQLRSRVRALQLQNLHQTAAARDLLIALRDRGIEPIFLKGVALRSTVYKDYRARPMGDVDVLVAAHEREPTQRVLESLGYRPFADQHASLWHARAASFALRELTFAKETAVQRVKIDLHWALTKGPRAEALDEGETRHDLDQFDLQGTPATCLSARWTLIHLCLHLFKDIVIARPTLLAYADLLLLIRRLGERIDWRELDSVLERNGIRVEVEAILRRLHTLDPDCLPAELGRRFAQLPPLGATDLLSLDESGSQARALASPGPYYRGLVSSIPGVWSRLRFVASLLVPSPRQLRQMQPEWPSPSKAAAYLRHWTKGVAIASRIPRR